MNPLCKLLALLLLVLSIHRTGNAQTAAPLLKVSTDITLQPLTPKAYLHTSVSEIEGFGMVASNGVVLIDRGKAFLFDTPVTPQQTETLVRFVADSLHAVVVGFVPNHWHGDCLGGLDYLHRCHVKSYAGQKTIDLTRSHQRPVPQVGFSDSLSLKLNSIDIKCYYPGIGHSADNIVVWLPSEKLLFAGCMVKALSSTGLGNTEESVVSEWEKTIEKLLTKFPSAHIVVPGHGAAGGTELLTHTLDLLKRSQRENP